nr:hypothetical protein [Methanobrevibacter arboriphilus]
MKYLNLNKSGLGFTLNHDHEIKFTSNINLNLVLHDKVRIIAFNEDFEAEITLTKFVKSENEERPDLYGYVAKYIQKWKGD